MRPTFRSAGGRAPSRHRGPAGALHFVNYVKQQLIDEDGSAKVFGGGLRVITTIDLDLQEAARDAISKWLTDPEGPSAALVAIDPRDGAVKAMVGGNNYRKSQFNLAVQGVRQPGSAFKPFVLATALRQGISPATRFESEPQSINLGDKDWVVGNYDDVYFGNVNLETATIESDNTVYAQLTQLVGSKNVAATAKRMGIRSKLDGYYAIGLGAEAVTPLELARAYATLAHGGRRVDGQIFKNRPRVIEEIVQKGKKRFNTPRAFNALSATQAGIVNSTLQKAVQFGTGTRANLPNRPVAGKTGTTENYGDAWFVGYTPQLVVAVWVGYPTTLRPMLTEFRGEPVTGGSFPALIWKSFAEKALKDEEPLGFSSPGLPYGAPKLVVRRGEQLLLDNGICNTRQEVVYFAGTGPSKTANCVENEVARPRRAQALDRRGPGAGGGTAADGQGSVQAGEAAPATRHRRRSAAEDRLPLLVRPHHPRRLEGDPGRDSEPGRHEPRRGTAAAETAEAAADDQLDDRKAGPRRRAATSGRPRRRPRREGRARRRARYGRNGRLR